MRLFKADDPPPPLTRPIPTNRDILFIACAILILVGYVVYKAMESGDTSLKSATAQTIFLALAAVYGYYMSGTAAQAKKDAPPDPPATVTTTVTTLPPEEPKP